MWWCVFYFVGMVEWTKMKQVRIGHRIPRTKTKMADVTSSWVQNQFSTRISTVNVTFEFILCSILEKAVTVLHNLYVTNHWRLFGIGADSLDTGNGLNSHRDQEWSPFNQPAGRSIDAFWDFFSDWNFFADPKFFFCLRNLGGSGNRKQTTFFSRP